MGKEVGWIGLGYLAARRLYGIASPWNKDKEAVVRLTPAYAEGLNRYMAIRVPIVDVSGLSHVDQHMFGPAEGEWFVPTELVGRLKKKTQILWLNPAKGQALLRSTKGEVAERFDFEVAEKPSWYPSVDAMIIETHQGFSVKLSGIVMRRLAKLFPTAQEDWSTVELVFSCAESSDGGIAEAWMGIRGTAGQHDGEGRMVGLVAGCKLDEPVQQFTLEL